jgi:poly-gamma-glutamate capsule biosynthesis protein CapA/YwtB (metallophosphatase superfamily)
VVARHASAEHRRWWPGALAGVLVVALAAGLFLRSSPAHSTSGTSSSLTIATSSTTLATTTTTTPTVTLAAVGDTELGNTPQLPADPGSYFAPVRAALAAPIVFGNLEGTMTEATTSKCSAHSSECYAFKVPTSYARIYRDAGFTVLNSANNHAWDFGAAGAASTSAALASVGIAQAGLPGQIALVHEGAVRVAFVDFAPYYNTNNFLEPSAFAALIARARREADVVVVYLHAGAEGPNADHVTRTTETFYGENRGNPYAVAHTAIDLGADLVIASGPHVLRGMEFYRGHLIAYSLGDFANYEDFATVGDLAMSAILHVTLSARGGFVSARLTSVLLAPSGQARVDPTGAAARFVATLSREDFGSSAAAISPSGQISPSTASTGAS